AAAVVIKRISQRPVAIAHIAYDGNRFVDVILVGRRSNANGGRIRRAGWRSGDHVDGYALVSESAPVTGVDIQDVRAKRKEPHCGTGTVNVGDDRLGRP